MAGGTPSDNLYVKCLPEEFDTDAIQQFFGACGTVTQCKALGHGCAMVRFSSVEEAVSVKENLHGQQPVGCIKPMEISFAVSRSAGKGWPEDGWKGGKGAKGKGVVVAPPTSFAWGDSTGGKGKARQWIDPSTFPSVPGDWTCSNCGDLNFARRTDCRKCGCPKDGWGDEWGGKGGGDWGPYADNGWGGKGKGKGAGGKTAFIKPGIAGLIDGLIAEGLPGGSNDKDSNALYVTNLPHDCTDEDLYTVFACFGAIPPRGTRVMPSSQPGSRVYGFVNFMDSATAEFALMAMNGVSQPDGCKLFVKYKDRKDGSGGWVKGGKAGEGKGAETGPAVPSGIDTVILQRLQQKLQAGPMSSYDISQWYIVEYLGHVSEEEEMKAICDMLLAACAYLGLE